MDPFFLSMVETQDCYRELKTYIQKKIVIDIEDGEVLAHKTKSVPVQEQPL